MWAPRAPPGVPPPGANSAGSVPGRSAAPPATGGALGKRGREQKPVDPVKADWHESIGKAGPSAKPDLEVAVEKVRSHSRAAGAQNR